jgi:hypothetical protein
MTVKEALLSIVNYPVPVSAIENIADARELVLTDVITKEMRSSNSYRLAQADLFTWVSFAPNISEGGISVDMLYSDRKELREKADMIYIELGEKNEKLIRQIFTFLGDDV